MLRFGGKWLGFGGDFSLGRFSIVRDRALYSVLRRGARGLTSELGSVVVPR